MSLRAVTVAHLMTRRVILYTLDMARWEGNAQGRLEAAALELFLEQGFAETTVPQIAARAGLTTRTFFRHFADKREVLFRGDAEVPVLVSYMMTQAPAALGPVALITSYLGMFAETVFGGQREALLRRHAVVQADAGLRERELRKKETVREAIVNGFTSRGEAALTAAIAADMAMAVLGAALERWLTAQDDAPLTEYVTEALRALEALMRQGAPGEA